MNKEDRRIDAPQGTRSSMQLIRNRCLGSSQGSLSLRCLIYSHGTLIQFKTSSPTRHYTPKSSVIKSKLHTKSHKWWNKIKASNQTQFLIRLQLLPNPTTHFKNLRNLRLKDQLQPTFTNMKRWSQSSRRKDPLIMNQLIRQNRGPIPQILQKNQK